MKLVNEEPYEINVDIYGIRDGPRLGRLRLQNKVGFSFSVIIKSLVPFTVIGIIFFLSNKLFYMQQPKLFEGFKFYFMGDFVPSYKGYLQDLVIAAGGTILHRKPVPEGQKAFSASSPKCQTFIIYSLEQPEQGHPSKGAILDRRQSDAKALASSAGAKAASNSWIFNSIAACKLQSFSE